MVACPPGCIRAKVYFDSNALIAWLRQRRRPITCEEVKARLRCAVCAERPAEVRIISKLWTFKLATLPGMPPGGR